MSYQLLSMVASLMPENLLIQKAEEKLINYKLAPSSDTRHEVVTSLQILTMRLMNEQDGITSPLDAMKKAQEMEDTFKLTEKIMNPDEN